MPAVLTNRRRALRRLGAAVTGAVCAAVLGGMLSACSGPTKPTAPAPPPAVKSFSASAQTVSSNGGPVQIDVSTVYATTCQLRSSSTLKGMPTKRHCKGGHLTVEVTIPPEKLDRLRAWIFNLDVYGAGGEVGARPVVVQQEPPGPQVVAFTASPSSMTSAGGKLTLTGYGDYGRHCEIGSKARLPYFPIQVPCGHSVARTIRLPANYSKKSRTFVFELVVYTTVTQHAMKAIDVPQAGIVLPAISSFNLSTTSLGASGGSVTLSGSVSNSLGCHFGAAGPRRVIGLPKWVLCGSGSASLTATVPANRSTKAVTYRFQMEASDKGLHVKSAVIDLTEAGSSTPPHPQKPTFNFSVVDQGTPVPASGGTKTLVVQNLTNATACTFSAEASSGAPNPSGLEADEPCSSSVTDTVTIPANTTSSTETYTFYVSVRGPGGTVRSEPKPVTVAARSSSGTTGTTTGTTAAAKAAPASATGPAPTPASWRRASTSRRRTRVTNGGAARP